MEDIILSPIPVKELTGRIEEIVEKAVGNIAGNQSEVDEVPLIRASAQYGISRQQWYNLHNRGVITLRKLEGKTFVLRSDISKAMREMKREKQSAADAKPSSER